MVTRVYFHYPVKSVEEMFDTSAMRTLDDVRTALALYDSIRSAFASDKDEEVCNTFDVQFMLARRCIEKRFDRNECVKLFDYVAYCYAWGDVHNLDYDPITLGAMEELQYKRDCELRDMADEQADCGEAVFYDTVPPIDGEEGYEPTLKQQLSDIYKKYRNGLDELCTCQSICDVIMHATAFHGVSFDDAWSLAVNKFGSTNIHGDSILRCLHTYADCHMFDDAACFVGYSED